MAATYRDIALKFLRLLFEAASITRRWTVRTLVFECTYMYIQERPLIKHNLYGIRIHESVLPPTHRHHSRAESWLCVPRRWPQPLLSGPLSRAVLPDHPPRTDVVLDDCQSGSTNIHIHIQTISHNYSVCTFTFMSNASVAPFYSVIFETHLAIQRVSMFIAHFTVIGCRSHDQQ